MPTQENEIYLALLIGAAFLLCVFIFMIILMLHTYIRIRRIQKKLVVSEILGSEKEKLRISENLHDDVNPLLSLSLMYLQMMDIKNVENKELLTKTQSIINESIDKIRTISHELSPYSIEQASLLKSVEQYAEKIKSLNNIDMIVYSNLKNKRVCNETYQLNIYRIIQEAVNNILKHANATEIRIGFYDAEDEIHIVIKDNGIGFDYSNEILFSSKPTQGIGLKNIYNRVLSMNGKLQITSKKNQGTQIVVILSKAIIA